MTANGWIQTFTGRKFSFNDPQPEDICIEDIAHALSLCCRFTGHTIYHYSVSTHSRHVSDMLEWDNPDKRNRKLSLWGLMHDASEAYLTDVPRPIKPFLPQYLEMEKRIQGAICDRFGLPREEPPRVKWADVQMLINEKEQIMSHPPDDWNLPKRERLVYIVRETPEDAEDAFLKRFRALVNES